MTVENGSKLFEEVFQNIRKTAEANLKLQQEAFQQWASLWPGVPTSQPAWVDKMRDFQKKWSDAVSDLAHKHKKLVDKEYQAAVESLDAALSVTAATNPEEFRRRSEQLCRKAIDSIRDTSEMQFREFQDVMAKFNELVTMSGK